MSNLGFILWLILYPVSHSVCVLLDEWKYRLAGQTFSDSERGAVALINMIFYFGVAYLLYSPSA